MKYIVTVLLMASITSAFGMTLKAPKIQSQGKAQYRDYVCKAKVLPINVRYVVTDRTINVELTFEKDLKGFQLFQARGVDSLEVYNFSKANPKDVLNKNKENLEFEYSKSAGLAYLVLEVRAKINGVSRTQIMTIPVGEQSREQINENKANIVTKNSILGENKVDSKTVKTKKIHKLKMKKAE